MISKVNSGDRLRIKARDWNAIADSVNSDSLGAGMAQRHRGLNVYNGTNVDWPAGTCVKITGAFDNGINADMADVQVLAGSSVFIFSGNDILGITLEDIHWGDYGRVALSGACYALFSDYDENIPYAYSDGNGKLRSDADGNIRVIKADAEQGAGVVFLNALPQMHYDGCYKIFYDGGTLMVSSGFASFATIMMGDKGVMSIRRELIEVPAITRENVLLGSSSYLCISSDYVQHQWSTPYLSFTTPSYFRYPIGYCHKVESGIHIKQFHVTMATFCINDYL